MKSRLQLASIASTYYAIWTADGIDNFHADADEIAAWLKREDLRTDEDTNLFDMTDEEIKKAAYMISEKVKDNMKQATKIGQLSSLYEETHNAEENDNV